MSTSDMLHSLRQVYTKPRYRWSRSAGVWVLQGAHRLAPVAIFPSNLRPTDDVRADFDTRIMRYHAYERRAEPWESP